MYANYFLIKLETILISKKINWMFGKGKKYLYFKVAQSSDFFLNKIELGL